MTGDSPKPTRIRHVVVFVAFLSALLLYLHRFCLSFTQQFVKEDLGISNDQFSWCLFAFFFAYALGQVPSGWMSDRFGARVMLTAYILVWSAFTALIGLAGGFVMLLLTRVGIGLGQAGAYPTSAALVGRWVPFSSRGKANSCVAFGGRLGGFLAPVLTAYLVVFFVPDDSETVGLSEQDILDPAVLCQDFKDALNSTPSSVRHLDEQTAAQHSVRASLYSQLGDAARRDIDDFATRVEQSRLPKELIAALQKLQVVSELATTDELTLLSLQREARSLAELSVRSPEQTHRLNRLVLEAVFPNSIRKLYVHGWRPVMFVYGSAGLIVAAVFWICFRERPTEHPWCNESERELIAVGRSDATAKPSSGGVPIKAIVRSRSLWLMCVNQFGGNVGWVFLLTWLPRYLLEVHSVPFVERSWMAAVPLGVGWMGILLGGWLTDRITGRFGLRWRTAPIVIGRYVAAVAYLACLFVPNAWVATAAFALIAFANDMGNPSSWSYKQDVGGRHVGAIHGWANMWGNFGAAVSPLFLQVLIREFGWNAAFVAGATAFVIAGTAALGVDARIPVVRDED
jgi:ACS family glucarate transporter-like MFS transporter